jgi:hypothetical protein
MTWSLRHSEFGGLAPGLGRSVLIGVCVRCEAQAVCNAAPVPNDIDISGEAVALNCGS